MSTPALKVNYFDAAGRAEPLRLALSIGGIPFEDVRWSREQFMEAKTTGKLPMGSLPTLEVDGKTVCQSSAMMNYVSKLAGLYPKDAFDGMKTEEVAGCLEDIGQLIYSTFAIENLDEKIAKRKELVDGKMGEKLTAFNKLLENNGKKLAVTDEITCSDVSIYCVVKMLRAGYLDGIPTDMIDKYPKIVACATAVGEHPAVVKWYADRAAK